MTWSAIIFAILGALLWLGAWANYRAAQAILRQLECVRDEAEYSLRLLDVRNELFEKLCARPGARPAEGNSREQSRTVAPRSFRRSAPDDAREESR